MQNTALGVCPFQVLFICFGVLECLTAYSVCVTKPSPERVVVTSLIADQFAFELENVQQLSLYVYVYV